MALLVDLIQKRKWQERSGCILSDIVLRAPELISYARATGFNPFIPKLMTITIKINSLNFSLKFEQSKVLFLFFIFTVIS